MVQPKVIKTAVITTSVVAIGLGVGLTVGRSKSSPPDNSSVQSDGGTPEVEYVDPSPKVSKDFMPAVVEETRNGDIVDTVDTIEAAQRYADMTGPEGGYAAYDVTDRQSAGSKANKGASGSADGKSGKSNSGSSKGSSHHGGVVKCIGSGKSGKSNSDGKSGKSNSTGGGAGKSGKSNSRMLRGNRELPSDGGKSGKSGGYESHDEWEGEWEEHKSWSSSSSTKWSSESTKWSSSSSSGDWKGEIVWVENDWSGKSVSLLYPYLCCSCLVFFVVFDG